MNNTENGAYHMPKSCCQNDIVEGAACDSDVAGKYMYHDGCIVSKLFITILLDMKMWSSIKRISESDVCHHLSKAPQVERNFCDKFSLVRGKLEFQNFYSIHNFRPL